jgi:DhnA family fructose-bisphosphate aldolase class Ia
VLLERASVAIEAGAIGLIFGRNFLKRERSSALVLAQELHRVFVGSSAAAAR